MSINAGETRAVEDAPRLTVAAAVDSGPATYAVLKALVVRQSRDIHTFRAGRNSYHVGAVRSRADGLHTKHIVGGGCEAGECVSGRGDIGHEGGAVIDIVAGGGAGPADRNAVVCDRVNRQSGSGQTGGRSHEGHIVNEKIVLVIGGVFDTNILHIGRQNLAVLIISSVKKVGLLNSPSEG